MQYSSSRARKFASLGMQNRKSTIFRIIQSIPSKKAEPVKKWLAEVGAQRVDQMIDPELTFQMAVEDYRRQGFGYVFETED